MWLINYIREFKVWREVKKVYKENQKDFEKMGIKSDWFGRLYKVINRDPKIPLGTEEDEILLSKELKDISEFLVKMNIMDILAYELIPQEQSDDETFENAYLVKLTPAWDLTKQYVSFKSSFFLLLFTCGIITCIYYLIRNFM